MEDIYERLVNAPADQFESIALEIMEDHIQRYPEAQQMKIRQQYWKNGVILAKYKSSTARLNKAIELFWGDYADRNQTFQHATSQMVSDYIALRNSL